MVIMKAKCRFYDRVCKEIREEGEEFEVSEKRAKELKAKFVATEVKVVAPKPTLE